MKTTVDISDSLLEEAKRAAARRGVTLRALLESGLRKVIAEAPAAPFRLRDASVPGKGLQGRWRTAEWERIRDAAYGLDGEPPDGAAR
ncbi:MAG: hypothetical protein AB7G13_05755 [Lautropia sp.]